MLKAFLMFEVADNTIRKETQRFGELQKEIEDEQQEHSTNINHFRERKRKVKELPKRVYGSMDGAHVPIKDPQENEKWKEMKVGTWYEVEKVPPSQQTKRHHKKEEIGHQALRVKNKLYYCDMEKASKFGELFWATGYEKKADLAQELVFVNDGAQWIWNLVETHYPHAKQILDWYHVEERLEKVADVAFSEETERNTWLESTRTALWEGRTSCVICACAKLADDFEEASQAETYFENNKKRMKYDQYRKEGYMIASGTVESACKQIVSHRLRCSSAQWKIQGGRLTGKARAACLSGEADWDKLCQKRAALPLTA